MSPEMQKKLLRVLQEGEFRVLGSDRLVKVDVRILAASHRDLPEMVREGTFREDLFYRIAVLSLDLPALRERRDDIPILAEHLLLRAAREAGREAPCARARDDDPVRPRLAGERARAENEMRRLLVLSGGEVSTEHLSETVRDAAAGTASPAALLSSWRPGTSRRCRGGPRAALDRGRPRPGRATRAARPRRLGISRFALQRKLDKYGIGKTRRRSSAAKDSTAADRAASPALDREHRTPVAPRVAPPRRRTAPPRPAWTRSRSRARAVRGGAVLHRARGAGWVRGSGGGASLGRAGSPRRSGAAGGPRLRRPHVHRPRRDRGRRQRARQQAVDRAVAFRSCTPSS